MLKPLIEEVDGKRTTYVCEHWRNFPPKTAFLENLREAQLRGEIQATDIQRHDIWLRICGLLKMDITKCKGCPHIRKLEVRPHQVGKLLTLDGKEVGSAVDATTIAQLGGKPVIKVKIKR